MNESGQVLLFILVWIVLHAALIVVLWRPIAPKDSAIERERRNKRTVPELDDAPRAQQDASRRGGPVTGESTTKQAEAGFTITFPGGNVAHALRVTEQTAPDSIMQHLALTVKPCIFISGGAGGMSDDDRQRVQAMINSVADFAASNNAVIIDGGTEAGVMQMVGEARYRAKHSFPLVGVAPLGKVAYPGYENPDKEAELEDGHSHFVLVEGKEWGDETGVIVRMMEAFRDGGKLPGVVILINGGSIALKEVHLATTQQLGLPTLVLEGSGRAADELSTAFRSGKASRRILKSILEGADIELIGVEEKPERIKDRLRERFDRQQGTAPDSDTETGES